MQGVAEPQQVPSGVSVPTAVPDVGAERAVPPAQPDTAVAVAPEGTGVADTGRGVREPVRGAAPKQPALSELDQQLIDAIQNKEKPLSFRRQILLPLRGRLASLKRGNRIAGQEAWSADASQMNKKNAGSMGIKTGGEDHH